MTDMRRIWGDDVLSIDDKNYLIKLLSEYRIVKWNPPQTIGPVVKPPFKKPFDKNRFRDFGSASSTAHSQQSVSGSGLGSADDSLTLTLTKESGSGGDGDFHETPKNPLISKSSVHALEKLFPTQEWVQNGIKYRQEISQMAATRLELALLRDGIRARMIEANARVTGICPIRENLTMRCLDEVIRISAINCAERGLYFSRIRDEMRMTLCCYKTLLSAGIDYGNEKFRQSLNVTTSLKEELQRLKDEKEMLRIENQKMRIQMKLMDRQFTDERNAVVEARKLKLGNVKRTCDQFIIMLETIGVEKHLYRHLV